MASYLLSWLRVGPTANDSPTPSVREISPQPSDSDDDKPPAFPSLSSAQRTSATATGLPRVITDSELMPPPPSPDLASRRPGVPSQTANRSSLVVPNTTKPMPKRKGKVGLSPGHSPLDWANLKASGENLRGVDTLLRVTPSELKTHNKRDDAWSVFCGKVYNITPFLSFHPGGEKELMRVAGRDGTKLFMATHSWVNLEFMMDACVVGFLVPEPS